MALSCPIFYTLGAVYLHCGRISKIVINMNFVRILIIISSVSFIFYGISYFTSTNMKNEFKRFGLKKFGASTAILEILGALGLLFGLNFHRLLLVSSGGLTVLMLLGVIVRIKMKDGFLISTPAVIYMLLNAFIFYLSI